jgi:cellulose biosynthesis protein BcsQ
MLLMALSTLYTARQNLDKNIRAKVVEKFTEDFVFQTTIPRAVAVGEATATLQAVVESNSESDASFSFRKLAAEIREVLGDEEVTAKSAQRQSR